MQKKIIALAVAGLASTAAFAQTNVQIYGIFDYGYSYRWDALVPGTPDSNSAFNGGQASGSRLGFKGTEDLGNGLKAVFLFEQGLSVDTSSGANTDADNASNSQGKSGSNNSTYTRQAYAGLSGNFGTLIGGRLYTPHFTLWSSVIDPFGAGTVGQYGNALGGALGGDVVRVDNAVAYVTPSFGGFTVTAAYSNAFTNGQTGTAGLGGTNENIDNGENSKVYAVLAQYVAGGLNVGFNYHYARFEGTSGSGTGAATTVGTDGAIKYGTVLNTVALNSTTNYTLGGNYDFKALKLHGAIAYNTTDGKGFLIPGNAAQPAATELEIWNYMLGVTVPVGKVDLKGSIIYSDADQWGDLTQYAIGANYNLSKRTDIYTAYSYIDASDKRAGATIVQGATGVSTVSSGVGDANNSGRGMGQGFQIGLRHKF